MVMTGEQLSFPEVEKHFLYQGLLAELAIELSFEEEK